MKHLQLFYIIVILSVFLASSAILPLRKKSTPKKYASTTFIAHTAPVIPDIELSPIPELRSFTQAAGG